MKTNDTQYYERCIATLREAFLRYSREDKDSIPQELYRSAIHDKSSLPETFQRNFAKEAVFLFEQLP